MTIALHQLAGQGLLTNSRMRTYKTCNRKHYISYELGIRPDTEAKVFRLGGAVHLGLDRKCKGDDQDAAIGAAVASYEVLPPWANTDEAVGEWMCERETVAALLAGYFWRWGDDNSLANQLTGVAEVIASELAFELPIRNPETNKATPTFKVAGKIDKIVRLADGRLAVMEHKTCGESIEPASDYWKRLRIDQQISLYMLAARELGHDVQTVLYDVIRKPAIRPTQIPQLDAEGRKIVLDAEGNRCLKVNLKKDGTPGAGHGEPYQSGNAEKGWTLSTRTETSQEFGERLLADITERPEFYFARQEIPRLDADLLEFRHELWQQAQAIRETQKTGRHFRNTNACTLMGRCQYFEQCTNSHDWTTVPAGFVRVEDIHPELTTEE
jgi:hypothetical protein